MIAPDDTSIYDFLDVKEPGFDNTHWQKYHELLSELNRRYHSPFSQTPTAELKQRNLTYLESMRDYHRFVIARSGQFIGWVDFQVRNAGTSEQAARFHYDALCDEPPSTMVVQLGSKIERLLSQYGCNSAYFSAVDRRGTLLARAWSARELSRISRYQLARDRAKLETIETWLAELPMRNPELGLRVFRAMPEEYLTRFAELLDQFMNDMPKERDAEKPFHVDADELRRRWLWREKNNVRVYTAVLLDCQDRPVAFSYCSVSLHDPSDAHQAMTGVERSYRGRGLSKWLKAVLFREVGKDFPENRTMTTEMRAVNEPIQRVNRQMGYMLLSEGAEFEITLDGLARTLTESQ
jgi:GNAT superfamily N-acetyltransferase